ncbi:site-2 protease family protein [Desulfosediminicola ganghwensis]|uniref:site-2 protease family protein n=1 Tax=Desulfosediminicola ganghwensis TaxID=2569540 RepID=UPI0010AD774E|nr:site-2 protease family protein [Desulfosediminicola ganghwensis]
MFSFDQIIFKFVILAPPILLALTLHEVAHGLTAYRLGDPTARNAGRLTLNPLKHLDPLGTLIFFIANFGWAKPVPVNPLYFRNVKQGMLLVALAGPATNLVLAVASAIILKVLLAAGVAGNPSIIGAIYPLMQMLAASVWINLVLCVLNLLPIPPLDGSKILAGILPNELASSYMKVERYGFIILLVLLFSGLLSKVILPIVSFANGFLLS